MAKIKNMEEFAALSGISRPTLSKYFHDPESVRISTRAKIEAALQLHDYRPNIYAMNQNRRLTKFVGIVVPFLSDPFFAEIARNVERHCIDVGLSPSLFSAHGDPRQEIDIMASLRSLRPAGVIFAPLGRATDRSELERFCHDVPTVLFDSLVEDIGATFVGSDNSKLMSQMVEYLCRTGSVPMLLEMDDAPNPNARKRRRGFLAEMGRRNMPQHVIAVPGEGWGFEEIGYREGLKVLSGKLPTNTILCSNDRMAIGLIAAAFELGLKVGHGQENDIRIAGLDDHPFSRFTCPPLTTVAQDYAAIAEESVKRLLTVIDQADKSERMPDILFDGRLVMRASA